MSKTIQGPFAAVITGVSHCYPGDVHDALKTVDLAIESESSLTLIGPSGAGKSTLLTLLDGRLRRWSGAAVVLDRPLNPKKAPGRQQRADIGFIFQDFALVERATVRDNVLNGRLGRIGTLASLFGQFSDEDQSAVHAAMRDAGVEEFADKRAEQLSGGQRQRVAIARCLAQEPRLILADEPVSNLDPASSENILRLISESARQRGATLVFSSHQPDMAAQFADRVIALDHGQIQFDGTPDELTHDQLQAIYKSDHTAKTRLRLVG